MLVTTCDSLPGYEIIEVVGVVNGVSNWINSREKIATLGKLLHQKKELKENDSIEEIAASAYQTALADAQSKAKEIGANAIIGLRHNDIHGSKFSHLNAFTIDMTTIAYGTAVKVRSLKPVAVAKPITGTAAEGMNRPSQEPSPVG